MMTLAVTLQTLIPIFSSIRSSTFLMLFMKPFVLRRDHVFSNSSQLFPVCFSSFSSQVKTDRCPTSSPYCFLRAACFALDKARLQASDRDTSGPNSERPSTNRGESSLADRSTDDVIRAAIISSLIINTHH